jgi:hypothetical protein
MNPDVLPLPACDRRILAELMESHERLIQRADAVQRLSEKEDKAYWGVLRCVCLLQAHTDQFPYVADDIANLARCVKGAFDRSLALRKSVERFSNIAQREAIEAYNDRLDNYPPDESWLRPTRLGNMVSTLESYPMTRYGINLSEIWPRLLHVITDDVRQRVEDATIYLDFTVLTSFLLLVAGIAGAVEAFLGPPRQSGLHVLVTTSFFLGCWLLYRLAIQATRSLSLQMQAAVDLFRLDLLTAMHIWFPNDPFEEKDVWIEVKRFIAQGELPSNITFKQETKAKQSTTEKKDQETGP